MELWQPSLVPLVLLGDTLSTDSVRSGCVQWAWLSFILTCVGKDRLNSVCAGRVGSQIVVPLRGDEHDYRHLRLMGDLGQITPLVGDLVHAVQLLSKGTPEIRTCFPLQELFLNAI